MKIKVPKRIEIASHTYDVLFSPRQLESAGSSGLTKHYYKEIILSKNLPRSELVEVFLHEYLHCVERIWVNSFDDVEIDRLAEGLCVLLNNLNIELDFSGIPTK